MHVHVHVGVFYFTLAPKYRSKLFLCLYLWCCQIITSFTIINQILRPFVEDMKQLVRQKNCVTAAIFLVYTVCILYTGLGDIGFNVVTISILKGLRYD